MKQRDLEKLRRAHEEEFAYLKNYIPKNELKHGIYYKGRCRNARIARWNENENQFYYARYKFGDRFIETINHPEDDNGFDLFYPTAVAAVVDVHIPFEIVNHTGRTQ